MSYVYMKVLESAPERYERGIRLLTLGRLERVRNEIAARVDPGDRVLDLGCGPGKLAVQLAHRGCQVTGLDISPAMLALAEKQRRQAGVEELVTFRELSVVEMEPALGDASFDAVVSTLLFSELSDDEIGFALTDCWRVLKQGGKLLVADEVLPDSALGRAVTFLLRLPFVVLAFLLTQTTTHRVAGLGERISEVGFQILDTRRYLMGTLWLYAAQKAG